MSLQAALGDEHSAGRSILEQLSRHIERYVEGVQIAIVYADQSRPAIIRNVHLFAGVYLDQHIHTQLVLSKTVKVSQGIGVQGRNNKKYCVGPGRRSFENLKLVKDKILAQDRQGNRFANCPEVVE